ncbi:hypothetical protein ACXWQW_09615, partial [Streptococcus pyogenes]
AKCICRQFPTPVVRSHYKSDDGILNNPGTLYLTGWKRKNKQCWNGQPNPPTKPFLGLYRTLSG